MRNSTAHTRWCGPLARSRSWALVYSAGWAERDRFKVTEAVISCGLRQCPAGKVGLSTTALGSRVSPIELSRGLEPRLTDWIPWRPTRAQTAQRECPIVHRVRPYRCRPRLDEEVNSPG